VSGGIPEQAYIERFASPIVGALRRIEAYYCLGATCTNLHQPALRSGHGLANVCPKTTVRCARAGVDRNGGSGSVDP
jgi:hypothetical protein